MEKIYHFKMIIKHICNELYIRIIAMNLTILIRTTKDGMQLYLIELSEKAIDLKLCTSCSGIYLLFNICYIACGYDSW